MKWKEYNNSCPILDSLQYEIIAILTITVLSLEWPLPPFHNLTQLASLVKTFLTTLYQRNLPQSTFTLYYYQHMLFLHVCVLPIITKHPDSFIIIQILISCSNVSTGTCVLTHHKSKFLLCKIGIAHLVPIAKIQCHQGKEVYLRI